MSEYNTEKDPETHAHKVLQLWESLTPEHPIEETEKSAHSLHRSSEDVAGLSKLAQIKHKNSFGYQMRRSLDMLSDELAQEGEIFRFSLIGGDHGNQNGYWKLFCNGLWVASINQGYAYRSFKDSPTGFIERIRKLIERKDIRPLSPNAINEIHRIESRFGSFKRSLIADSGDSDAFASAWAVFIAKLKEEDAY